MSGADDRAVADFAVVGGGPAGLYAAYVLSEHGARVRLFEGKGGFGRKFLLAGRGGLNLTNDVGEEALRAHYGAAAEALAESLRAFGPAELRAFASELGIETFVGTSGRVFPRSHKASPLLRAWLTALLARGVSMHPRHRLVGLEPDGTLCFESSAETAGETFTVRARAVVLALGGASWPKTGSDAAWVPLLQRLGVKLIPWRPANCGFEVAWTPEFAEHHAGSPIKNVRVSAGGLSSRGEILVTRYGLEGGGIYDLSAAIRDEIEAKGSARIHVDLKPDVEETALAHRFARPRGKLSLSNFVRRTAHLPHAAAALLGQSASDPPTSPEDLAKRVKDIVIVLRAPRKVEEAISSAGGIALEEVDEQFQLRRCPGVFVAGEMLDWEAPTGGFLLQACFATGRTAALGALAFAGDARVRDARVRDPRVRDPRVRDARVRDPQDAGG